MQTDSECYIDNYWKAVKHLIHTVKLKPDTKCFTLNPFAIQPNFGDGKWLCNQRNMDIIKEFKTFPKRGVTWIETDKYAGAYAFKFQGRKPTEKSLIQMSKTTPHEILYRLILDRDGMPINEDEAEEM